MKLTIFVLFGCALCWGGVAGDCKPSSLNIPGAPYPCVHPDRRVTFRVAAPDAQKVQVRLGGAHDMTRGDRRPVDGHDTAAGDRVPLLQHRGGRRCRRGPGDANVLRLGMGQQRDRDPGADADAAYYSAADVPHGQVSQRWYYSKVTGKWRRCLRIHAAGVRGQCAKPLPGSLSAPWLGRERAGLAHAGPRRISSWTTSSPRRRPSR